VTYWFFYPYSSPLKGWEQGRRRDAAHEGDWENVTVHVTGGEPKHVAYYSHGDPLVCDWLDAPRENDRPVVYSAWGSHASYATADFHPPVDRTAKHLRWDTARDLHILPAAADGARISRSTDPEVSWYGYGGAWGRVGYASETTGPLGPSMYKRGSPRTWTPQKHCK
jgi:hypothetical protein